MELAKAINASRASTGIITRTDVKSRLIFALVNSCLPGCGPALSTAKVEPALAETGSNALIGSDIQTLVFSAGQKLKTRQFKVKRAVRADKNARGEQPGEI